MAAPSTMGAATTASKQIGERRSSHAHASLLQEMSTLSQSQIVLEDVTYLQGNDQGVSVQQGDAAPNLDSAIPISTDSGRLMVNSGSVPDLASLEEILGSMNDDELMDTLGTNSDHASLEEITNSLDDDELKEYIRSDSDLASLGEIPDSTDADRLMDILGSDSDLEELEAEIAAFNAVVNDFLRAHRGS